MKLIHYLKQSSFSFIFVIMKSRHLFLLFLLLLVVADASAQCSMCKSVVETDGASGGSIRNGINPGILYLLAVPYVLLMLFFRKKIGSFLRELLGLWR